jgi:DNA-binding LacI/PurR family transcriptional regulator
MPIVRFRPVGESFLPETAEAGVPRSAGSRGAKTGMTNIREVARRAGVSTTSVSNVLNGRTNLMREETRQRIEAVMRELDYRPNRAALQLKTGRSEMIGLLVPSIANPSFAALAQAVEQVARDRWGHRVLLGNTHRRVEEEGRFFADLIGHGISEVIVVASDIESDHFRAAVDAGLVMIDYDGRRPTRAVSHSLPIDSVSMNNFRAGEIATRHLVDADCRSLVFLTEVGRINSRREKIAGFMAAAADAGVAARVIEGKAVDEFGDALMIELGREHAGRIADLASPPDGIVCLNDMMAIGLLGGLRDRGVAVPQDVCVVGIDDVFLSPFVTPSLSSVKPPLAALARLMIDRLISRRADPSLPVGEFLLEPTLSARDSVAPRPDSAVLDRPRPDTDPQ